LENQKPYPPGHIDEDPALMVSLQKKLKLLTTTYISKAHSQRQFLKKSLGQQSSMFVECLSCPLLLETPLPPPKL